MRLLHFLMLTLLVAAPLCGTARAQQPDFTGAWSFQVGTFQGTIASTVFIRPDGGFVRADRLANGTMLRQWGQYSAQQIGPNSFRIDTQIQGYLPHTSCVAIPGFARRCQAAPPAQNLSTAVTITSPSTIMSDGMVWQRDLSGGLLNVPVPDTSIIAGNAPTRPNIRQPVRPQLHPYVTPNGPGNQMSKTYHDQNKVWTDTRMRGCNIDQYGRRYGCQQ